MTELFQKTDLEPKFTLVLKALLLYVLVIYQGIFFNPSDQFPFLPFIPFLDYIPSVVFTAAISILFLSIISILLKKGNYRILSLLSGFIILSLILSSRTFFSNSLTFVACLLILIGLYKKSTIIFRIQIALLYLGAAVNKMFDPDWWNGYYFDFFMRDVFNVALYQSLLPDGNFLIAKGLGIATISIELFLGIGILIPRITRLTIIFGLIFHTGMLVITTGRLSFIFLYIMSAAYLVVSGLSLSSISLNYPKKWIAKLFSWLDLSESINVGNSKVHILTVIKDEQLYQGRKALLQLLISPQILLTLYFLAILSRYTLLPILKSYI